MPPRPPPARFPAPARGRASPSRTPRFTSTRCARRAGGARCERRRRGGVRAVRPLALLAGERGEIGRVRREPRDLEWHRGRTLELPLSSQSRSSGHPALPRTRSAPRASLPRRRRRRSRAAQRAFRIGRPARRLPSRPATSPASSGRPSRRVPQRTPTVNAAAVPPPGACSAAAMLAEEVARAAARG